MGRGTLMDEEIRKMIYKGSSYNEIRAMTGMSLSGIVKLVKRLHLNDKVRISRRDNRTYIHENGSTRIFWSKQMLDDLKSMYPDTLNQEVAEYVGVSWRTLRRKAKELDLKKDPDFIKRINKKNLFEMHLHNRLYGNAGMIKKGEHRSPETEFKKKD
jgi:hypothetical protein